MAKSQDAAAAEIRKELEAAALADAGRNGAMAELRSGLKGVSVAMRRMRGRETHLHGQQLSYAQFHLMFSMWEQDRSLSARELAHEADLTPASVTQMLDALEGLGLVARSRSTEDKRVVLTELTDKGRGMLAARRAQMEPRWAAVLADFSDEQLHSAAAVLNALAGYFNTLD